MQVLKKRPSVSWGEKDTLAPTRINLIVGWDPAITGIEQRAFLFNRSRPGRAPGQTHG